MSSLSIYLTFFISSLALSGCLSSPTSKNGEEQNELKLLWEYEYDLDGGAPRVIPKIIDDLHIISSGDNSITSLNLKNGEINWKTSLDHHTSLRNRTFGNSGEIVAGSVSGRMIAWDLNSGIVKWSKSFQDTLTYSNLSGIVFASEYFLSFGTSEELYKISLNGGLDVEW